MSILTYIKKHSVISAVAAIFVIVVMIVAGRMMAKSKIPIESVSNIKNVVLAEVSQFRTDASVIYADGIVESISQADLKSQISAPVLNIYVSIGDSVNKGQTILELQNADIKAQLEQARATLALARSQYETGNVSVDSVYKKTVDEIRDSYFKADDAVNTQIGQFLFNRNPEAPQLSTIVTDSRIYNDMSLRWTQVTSIFAGWKKVVDTLSYSSDTKSIDEALLLSQKNLALVTDLLDVVSSALVDVAKGANASGLSSIALWKQTVSAARNSISISSSAITSTQITIANTQVAHTSPGQAQISVAEAGVRNLEAQLAKTIISSPISGKISSLPLRAGELASPGSLLSTVIGSGGLQVKAYVSAEDLSRINKDAPVLIRGDIKGLVASLAPSVSQTSKKAEIKISILDTENSGLVVGESIQAVIKSQGNVSTKEKIMYILPIQNVKIVPGDAYVFVVDEESKAKRVPVILGEVKGGFVEIKSGISDEMKIVSPVYEITEGETVHIRQ